MIDISKFTDEQREVLSDAICYLNDGRVFALIANTDYTPAQMKELLMCTLNGTSAHLMEPWELPDGMLEKAREEDYIRVKELAATFSCAGNGKDKPSVAVKLYTFSQETNDNSKSLVEDSIVR